MKVFFVGATRGMGRALARRLAARGDDLFLVGRDPVELARSAADLEARSGRRCAGTAALDLLAPEGFPAALDAAEAALGRLELAVVTAGDFAPQEALAADPARLRRLLAVNVTGTIALCEQLAQRLLASGGGTLCAFSSVAGDRGRTPVALYGASKAALSAYLEALDHRHRRDGLAVVCVKPGFVRTSMTDGLPVPPFAGDPEGVARVVERALDRRAPVVYAPSVWRWVMWVVRRLPRAVMRRVRF